MSDIKFIGNRVQIEGHQLKVTSPDVELDNAGRRKNNTGIRRALVHDFQDGLTLNWAEDYPGGVTIRGDVKMPQGATISSLKGTVLRLSHHDIELDNASRRKSSSGKRRALVHDQNDGLTMNWAGDYPGGITLKGKVKIDEIEGTHLKSSHHDLHLNHPSRRNDSYYLNATNIVDWIRFIRDLAQAGKVRILSPGKRVWEVMTPSIKKMIQKVIDDKKILKGNMTSIVNDLNKKVIDNRNFYEAKYFKGITNTKEVQNLLSKRVDLTQVDVQKMNRRILESIFINDIVKAPIVKAGDRRALVHDFDDGLTINWAKDYPGGVTIRGDVKLPEKLIVKDKDILSMIQELTTQVATLQGQVTQLTQRLEVVEKNTP